MSIKLIITFLAISLSICGRAQKPETPIWVKTEPYGHHEHKTVLQFYFHDIILNENPTSILIAQPLNDNKTDFRFGSLFMVDDPLTLTPDPNSKLLGRAQGFFGRTSKEDISLIMGLALSFIDGMYNGSSIVIFTHIPIMNTEREFPVVGGTGLFRMARGFAEARTYFSDPTTFNAIVGYNVTIFHP
ncbi:dirigent protein 23-like [Amaranthus tricolor]|uniref:dirigent protein 23-like n=1 Tax=Amaranthus tricolor TaxID=29722 RepID=UPI00258FF9B5|nr:dirigent protein 23-like [Amaranthus tricolor]